MLHFQKIVQNQKTPFMLIQYFSRFPKNSLFKNFFFIIIEVVLIIIEVSELN